MVGCLDVEFRGRTFAFAKVLDAGKESLFQLAGNTDHRPFADRLGLDHDMQLIAVDRQRQRCPVTFEPKLLFRFPDFQIRHNSFVVDQRSQKGQQVLAVQ